MIEMFDELDWILADLEMIVNNFCFMIEKRKIDEISWLKIISMSVPVNKIGEYHGKHFKKT